MKKMKKSNKGFTLTELAIVIAVIAILIAVLVPTFTSLINKAHESTDSQLAKNMNTLLANEEASGNTPERMEDVNQILVEGGYTIAKLTPSADGNIFVWNEETNRISYISEDGTVLFAGDSSLTADGVFTAANNYWVTVESANEIESWSGLSYYFGANISEDITFATADSSIDTGTYKLTGTLTYGISSTASVNEKQSAKTSINSVKTGKAATSSTTSGTATLRGTISTLVVNTSSTLNVVNYASITTSATLAKVTTYTESGSTKALTVTSGKVVVENNGYVKSLTLSSSSATLENSGYIASLTNSASAEVKNSGYITGATDNISYSYKISNYTELANFRDKVNNGTTFEGITVELTADIDISDRTWIPIGYDSRDNYGKDGYIYFGGIFNGNNHTISGLTNTGFTPTITRTDTYGTGSAVPKENNYLYGLFGNIRNATIENLTMTNVNIVVEETYLDSVGAIAGFGSGSITITNCDVYGSIDATDAAAGIIGRIYSNTGSDKSTISITYCNNYADITITKTDNTTSKAAGIVSYINDSTKSYSMTISNCNNYGDISANIYTAGIMTISSNGAITIKNCSNSGNITSTNDTNSASTSNVGSIVCDTRYTFTNSSGTKSVTNYNSNITVIDCSNDDGSIIKSNGNGYLFNYVDGKYTVTATGSNTSLNIGTGSTIKDTETEEDDE